MSARPSYLGLLNAITVGEARGYQLLSAWAQKTDNRGLAEVLNLVAIRENEHAGAFAKRLCELGYAVREAPNQKFDTHLAYVNSDASDEEKFAKVLGLGGEADDKRPDARLNLFADESIDPQTGALLGRFIAEERDSKRRLNDARKNANKELTRNNDDLLLQEIAERLNRLTTTIEELEAVRQ